MSIIRKYPVAVWDIPPYEVDDMTIVDKTVAPILICKTENEKAMKRPKNI